MKALVLTLILFISASQDTRIIRPILFKSDQFTREIKAQYDHSIYPMFCDEPFCNEYAYLMYYHSDTTVTLLCKKHMKEEK